MMARAFLLGQGGVVAALVFGLLAWGMSRPVFFQRCVGEGTAGSLGAIRMLICSILLISTLWEDLGSSAVLPREMIHPSGVIRLFYFLPIGFKGFVADREALILFQRVTLLLLLFGAVGWKTRWTVPAGGFCYLVMAGLLRQYAWFYHQGVVPLYVIGVLSLTPCGDGWSLDRLLKIAYGQPAPLRPGRAYGWARYACWVAVALPYVAAGLSKVRNGGWMWWGPDNMRNILYRDTLNPMQFEWTFSFLIPPQWDLPFALLGLSALFGELTFGLVLLSRWARRLLPVMMAGMHLGIWFLQNVLFFDLILLQMVFYDLTCVRQRAGMWLRRRTGGLEVLYDGLCPLCRRTVRLLQSVDLLGQLHFSNFRSGAVEEMNRRYGLNLSFADAEEQMFVIRGGRALGGFTGYRALAAVLPLFWPIALWLYLPGIPRIGQAIYQRISRARMKRVRCSEASCPGAPGAGERPALLPELARERMGWPLGIAALSALLIFCWYGKIEQYPFTAMQMYTRSTSKVVVYYRIMARTESGAWVRAYPEKVIPAMSDGRYRRCIRLAFDTGDRSICEKFFRVCGSEHNRGAGSGERWTTLEVQKWVWDYRESPSDPAHGQVSDRLTIPLKGNQG